MRRRYNSQNSVFISTEEILSCNGNKYCIELLLRFLLHARQFLLLPSRLLQLYLSLSFYTALQSLPVLCGLRSWSRAWQLWSWPSGAQRVRDSCDWSMFPLLRPAVTTVTRNGTWIYRDHQQTRAGASNEGSQRIHNHGEGPYSTRAFFWLKATTFTFKTQC